MMGLDTGIFNRSEKLIFLVKLYLNTGLTHHDVTITLVHQSWKMRTSKVFPVY